MKDNLMLVVSKEQLQDIVSEAIDKALSFFKTEVKKDVIPSPTNEIISLVEATQLLGIAKSTLYGLTSRNEIPFYKKGKRLYFKRTELLDWINGGKQKTSEEIEEEAKAYLRNR